MTPGKPPHPRLRLNPEFRKAVRAAMLNGRPSWVMAELAGFPNRGQFSSTLHARRISVTPLTLERLHRVADVVEFPREAVFIDEETQEGA